MVDQAAGQWERTVPLDPHRSSVGKRCESHEATPFLMPDEEMTAERGAAAALYSLICRMLSAFFPGSTIHAAHANPRSAIPSSVFRSGVS